MQLYYSNMFRNICLIGLPYSGKTTVGKKLYKHLKKGFIDTDDIIRNKYNMSLSSIIHQYGNQQYLKIEQDVIKSLTCKNTVISTGGSIIYEPLAIKYLKNELDVKIYHLFLSKQEFLKRADNLTKRGVIIDSDKTITDLYNERISLYDKYADETISACRDIPLDMFNHKFSEFAYGYNNSDKKSYQDRYKNKLWQVHACTIDNENVYWDPKPKSSVLKPLMISSKPCSPV